MFDGALRDVRYAVRILAKTPGFLAAAVLSVALGIGASTTMFSAFRAVFLRPLPYRDADRLVKVTKTGGDHRDRQVTVGDVLFWREHARSFQSLGTFGGFRMMTLTGVREPTNLIVHFVSAEIFPTLDSPALLGRTLGSGDFGPGMPPAAVLSYSAWQKQLGGDSKNIGREIMLDGRSYVVVGVMPEGFIFPWPGTSAWAPDETVITDPLQAGAEVSGGCGRACRWRAPRQKLIGSGRALRWRIRGIAVTGASSSTSSPPARPAIIAKRFCCCSELSGCWR
jgi:hypothetical protein